MNEIVKICNKGKQKNPEKATSGSAGYDIRADITEDLIIKPNETVAVPTGLYISMPEYMECQIRPRSGLSFKTGLRVSNAPGTIDSDYRGEIKVLLTNIYQNSEEVIKPGDRIAQMVFCPIFNINFDYTEELDNTHRGSGGFGSTGKM